MMPGVSPPLNTMPRMSPPIHSSLAQSPNASFSSSSPASSSPAPAPSSTLTTLAGLENAEQQVARLLELASQVMRSLAQVRPDGNTGFHSEAAPLIKEYTETLTWVHGALRGALIDAPVPRTYHRTAYADLHNFRLSAKGLALVHQRLQMLSSALPIQEQSQGNQIQPQGNQTHPRAQTAAGHWQGQGQQYGMTQGNMQSSTGYTQPASGQQAQTRNALPPSNFFAGGSMGIGQ